MTHDYKRNGTTTLFAALNVLDGKVIAQCQQRHTPPSDLKFLKKIDRRNPKGKALHLIADNYATHKHPSVQRWLDKHPRFNDAFHAHSASWLNMVERFFRDITTERLRRGVFPAYQSWSPRSMDTSHITTPNQTVHLDQERPRHPREGDSGR